VLAEIQERPGIETELIDFATLPIPSDEAGDAAKDPAFAETMNRADAIVIVGRCAVPSIWRAGRVETTDQWGASAAETERALLRPRNMNRYRYRPEDVREFLDGLAASAQLFRDVPRVPAVTRDPSDDRVIACAVAARADYLVTGDDDMLVLGEHKGIRIVTPRQILDLIQGAGPG